MPHREPGPSTPLTYRIDDLVIDAGRFRVSRGGQELQIPGLSFDLLLALIRAAPNVVSIDTLITQVWPGLVVSPETVSQRVKLLRDALGDDPKAPRYIAGVRGRGYQLIAPITIESTAEPTQIAVASVSGAALEQALAPGTADLPALARATSPAPAPAAPDAAPASTPALSPTPAPAKRRLVLAMGAAALIAAVVAALFYSRSDDAPPAASKSAQADSVIVSKDAFSPPPHSVAVLAFSNLSGDSNQEYFSDGLSEELLHALVRIEPLKVAARTSSFSFKNAAVDIPTMGRKLNVGAILEGSVRRAGDRVRITAQLVSTDSGFHLWSETYDRKISDIFALQTEIATSVANALKVALIGNEQGLLAGGTSNPKALDAYLRGNRAQSSREERAVRAALAHYDEALALDPQYALAHVARAQVLVFLAGEWVREPVESKRMTEEALATARKAVEIAPSSGRVYATYVGVLMDATLDIPAVDAAFEHGLEVEPGNPELQLQFARQQASLGRAGAYEAIKRALALDPLSQDAQFTYGITLHFLRRPDESRAVVQAIAARSPDPYIVMSLGLIEIADAKPAVAAPLCERSVDFFLAKTCLAMAYHKLGRQKEAEAMLERALREMQGSETAYYIAQVYAQWDQPQRALEWLEKSLKQKEAALYDLKADPLFDPLRKEPRFKGVLRELGLPA